MRRAHRLLALLFLALGSSLAVACTRDNPDFFGVVERPDQAGVIDGPPVDLGVDLTSVDLSFLTPDLATHDLAESHDFSHHHDLSQQASCTDLYGALPAFMLCASAADRCVFYLNSSEKTSCAAICAGLGGSACVGEKDVDTVSCDASGASATNCSDLHHDIICACAR